MLLLLHARVRRVGRRVRTAHTHGGHLVVMGMMVVVTVVVRRG